MAERHIPEGLFRRFLRQETSRDESREIVRHLLTGCPQCSETGYRVVSEIGLVVPPESPQPAWEEAYEGSSPGRSPSPARRSGGSRGRSFRGGPAGWSSSH